MAIFGSRNPYAFENPLVSDPEGKMRFEAPTLSHPHNPILALLRLRAYSVPDGHVTEYLPSLEDSAVWQWEGIATPEHIDHARRVLSRLAERERVS